MVTAFKLTVTQRRILMRAVDPCSQGTWRPQDGYVCARRGERRACAALVMSGFLRVTADVGEGSSGNYRWKQPWLCITEAGRFALALVDQKYADSAVLEGAK